MTRPCRTAVYRCCCLEQIERIPIGGYQWQGTGIHVHGDMASGGDRMIDPCSGRIPPISNDVITRADRKLDERLAGSPA